MKTRLPSCALWLLAMCAAMPFDGHSQLRSVNKPIILLGVKANAQSAGIANQNNYGQNEMDYGLHFGVGGGLAVTYVIKPRIAVLAEVSYQTSGQDYDDHFKGRHFQKEVSFQLISIPVLVRYQMSNAPTGYGGVGTETKPLWYVQGGLQVNRMLTPEMTWTLDGATTDFLSFVLEGGNGNQALIEAMGTPASDKDLFTGWDLAFTAAGGCQLSLAPQVYLTLEMRGGIGLTDMNAKPWRLKNNRSIYQASRNTFLGLHAGVHLMLVAPE